MSNYPSLNDFIGLDITDPTPWEEEVEDDDDDEEKVYRVLCQKVCPVCKEAFYSDQYLAIGQLSGEHDIICHDDCLCDEAAELLEKIGYTLITELGRFYDTTAEDEE